MNAQPINEREEYRDMNERGRQAYRRAKRRSRRFHLAVIGIGIVFGIAGFFRAIPLAPAWLQFVSGGLGLAFAWASFSMLIDSRPDISALAQGRMAEHPPPQPRTWSEHVEEFGPDCEECREALKSGEVDEPEWRKDNLANGGCVHQ